MTAFDPGTGIENPLVHRPTPNTQRTTQLATLAVAAATVAVLPFARHAVGFVPVFYVFYGIVLVLAQASASALLLWVAARSGGPGVRMYAAAYCFTAIMLVASIVALFASGRAFTMVGWFSLVAHLALPLAIIIATDRRSPAAMAPSVPFLVALTGAAGTLGLAPLVSRSFPLISAVGSPTSAGRVGLGLVIVVSLVALWRLVRRAHATTVNLILGFAVFALLADSALTLTVSAGFTVGTYGARIIDLAAGLFVAISLARWFLGAVKRMDVFEQFMMLADTSPIVMFFFNERHGVFAVNARWTEYTGLSKGQTFGRGWLVAIHPDDRRLIPMVPHDASEEYKLRIRAADGSYARHLVRTQPVYDRSGYRLGWAGTSTNVESELQALDDSRERNEKLQSLNRALESASQLKSQFVATMSHELRTPLTAIISASELLSVEPLGRRQQISVRTIETAAEALMSLIGDILDFAKIEAGKLELEAVPLEVETIVEHAADVAAALIGSKELVLHTYVDPALPPLCGDPTALRQILLNLLGNAVKFTPRGHVLARAVAADIREDEVIVRFDVRDTGIGIDPEKQARLFEPFVQADGSIARSFGGTGLGLSICKRLAEMMGGEIGLQTQPGIGSSFWFTARFARVRENPAPRRKAFSQVRALVLSRDQTFRYVVRQYLWAWSVPSYHEFEPRGITQRLARPDDAVWVAIVDRDDVDADLIAAMQASGVIGPERVVMVSHDIELRKPIHAASLYAAITNAIEAAPRPALAPIRASLPEPPPRLAGRVLVAEDNVTLQRLMKLQFDALGVPVTFVSDGREAVDAVRDHRFPIVFMDCHMPVMDGLAAAREIRASVHGEHVPVIIAMTANALAEDRAACTAAGMDDYLPKPVLLGALRDMLARWAHAPVGVR